MTSLIVSVYTSDAATFIGYVPRREGVEFLHELNGDGRGQFIISLDDPILTSIPTLLAEGNVVKVRASTSTLDSYSWRIQNLTRTLTAEGDYAARKVTVSGLGQRTRFASGCVFPEGGLKATSTDDRGFDFAGIATSPWLVSGDWVTPTGVAWSSDVPRHGNPPGWPDTTAKWLWSSDPDATSTLGFNWFRSPVFNLAVATDIAIYATADDILSLRLDGETVLETDPSTLVTWREMFVYTTTLAAGNHIIAARVENTSHATATNAGAFICVAASVDADGIPVTVLTRTDTTNWKVHSYTPEPGWHAASILKALVAESQARSDAPLVPLTFGFTDTVDSAGTSWTDRQGLRFNIGDDLLTVLDALISLGIDVEVTPALVVDAYVRKGTDLSASVRLRPGADIVQNVPTAVYGGLRNSALVRHATGWLLVEDAASIAAHGRRSAGLLSFGGSETPAQATQMAQAHFDETAHPQVTLPITITSAAGPQPYTDFVLGDTLMVPGLSGVMEPARLMSIAATEGDGVVVWDLDFYPEVA